MLHDPYSEGETPSDPSAPRPSEIPTLKEGEAF